VSPGQRTRRDLHRAVTGSRGDASWNAMTCSPNATPHRWQRFGLDRTNYLSIVRAPWCTTWRRGQGSTAMELEHERSPGRHLVGRFQPCDGRARMHRTCCGCSAPRSSRSKRRDGGCHAQLRPDRRYDGMAPAFVAVNAGKKSMV
jgi:hypothetical protein